MFVLDSVEKTKQKKTKTNIGSPVFEFGATKKES